MPHMLVSVIAFYDADGHHTPASTLASSSQSIKQNIRARGIAGA